MLGKDRAGGTKPGVAGALKRISIWVAKLPPSAGFAKLPHWINNRHWQHPSYPSEESLSMLLEVW